MFANLDKTFANSEKQFAGCLTSPSDNISSPTQNSPDCSPSDTVHSSTLTDGPSVTNKIVQNTPSSNVESKPSMKLEEESEEDDEEYDLNGDRDFLYFNITKYDDEQLNRIGAKKDEEMLKKTFFSKGFKLKAYRNEWVNKKTIVDDLKHYVNNIEKDKRNVKVLIIAFMAHGGADDVIIFSDKKTYKYRSLLNKIFECEKLQGVPKIIINQFCRGKFNMNTAYTDTVTSGNAGPDSTTPAPRINGQADLLECFATAEGNRAVRGVDGSHFIQNLCFLLKEWLSWISISALSFISLIAYSQKEKMGGRTL